MQVMHLFLRTYPHVLVKNIAVHYYYLCKLPK